MHQRRKGSCGFYCHDICSYPRKATDRLSIEEEESTLLDGSHLKNFFSISIVSNEIVDSLSTNLQSYTFPSIEYRFFIADKTQVLFRKQIGILIKQI